VCYFDLDGFKAINDSLGHAAGDDLLRVVARRLQQVAGAEGATAVRIGGDEFVVLVQDSPGTAAVVDFVEQALAEITRPVRIGGHELAAEASAGIVERPVAGIDADELLRDADLTLYRAKHEGGGGQWALYDSERTAALRQRSTLSAALPAALQHNELFVEYEPIVWLQTAQLVAVEATVRWDHPDLGELDANRFLGPAANSGLSTRLGSWLLERVCEHAQRWTQRFGSAAPIPCVDLAPRHFRDPELVSDLQRILRDTGLPADWLVLGVPEAALFDQHDHPVDTLEIFTEMGLRLGVHDFGRGNTHLPRLRNLPIQAVKISGDCLGSFAEPSGPDPLDEHFVAGLVGSAHLLGLFVIADGVHTERQATRLQQIGVHGAKGDYAGGLISAMEVDAAITQRIA
jgi:diguanylate cyclase (GGDEF)-like protein